MSVVWCAGELDDPPPREAEGAHIAPQCGRFAIDKSNEQIHTLIRATGTPGTRPTDAGHANPANAESLSITLAFESAQAKPKMCPDNGETSVSLDDVLPRNPDDKLSTLVAALLDLLCNDFGQSLGEARKLVATEMGGLYPHVAFDRMPVSARLQ